LYNARHASKSILANNRSETTYIQQRWASSLPSRASDRMTLYTIEQSCFAGHRQGSTFKQTQ